MDVLLPTRHSMVIHQSNAWQRSQTVAWMADALSRGDKVLHRAVDDAMLAGLGSVAGTALDTGQLELVDAHQCHEETDGRHERLRDLHIDLIARARADGYPGVLLTADDLAPRLLTPDPVERLAHERDLEWLTSEPGVRVLCCYDVRVEHPELLDAVAGVHYRSVDDILWSARCAEGRLLVRGEIDADNAGRFGAVLTAAVADGVTTADLAEVTILSAAGSRAFETAVDVLRDRAERLRLVNASPTLYRALTLLRLGGDGLDLVARTESADGLAKFD